MNRYYTRTATHPNTTPPTDQPTDPPPRTPAPSPPEDPEETPDENATKAPNDEPINQPADETMPRHMTQVLAVVHQAVQLPSHSASPPQPPPATDHPTRASPLNNPSPQHPGTPDSVKEKDPPTKRPSSDEAPAKQPSSGSSAVRASFSSSKQRITSIALVTVPSNYAALARPWITRPQVANTTHPHPPSPAPSRVPSDEKRRWMVPPEARRSSRWTDLSVHPG
ncbi:hypothetical protein BDK51DRAFT_51246 [Blyttiomyces helicus]|uniref:Uncharacterized protein n=1 Tax=Blyttiomyces helicus TaxID=388810 RepID=A0A4P9WLX5_9FUNG|nr:hypothetical protein BDK51DRAFT_51246 [Blyttiomyces helicus]|eukprot:RKO93894.1 hypothetical protein BDK51DRAFT_51246 [Blyttiomyces helicus]